MVLLHNFAFFCFTWYSPHFNSWSRLKYGRRSHVSGRCRLCCFCVAALPPLPSLRCAWCWPFSSRCRLRRRLRRRHRRYSCAAAPLRPLSPSLPPALLRPCCRGRLRRHAVAARHRCAWCHPAAAVLSAVAVQRRRLTAAAVAALRLHSCGRCRPRRCCAGALLQLLPPSRCCTWPVCPCATRPTTW